MRVVLDANVLVSGVIAPGGSPAEILDAWQQERLQPVIPPAIVEELARVLRYPRVKRYHRWLDTQIVTHGLRRLRGLKRCRRKTGCRETPSV